jgi:hypothetical protein
VTYKYDHKFADEAIIIAAVESESTLERAARHYKEEFGEDPTGVFVYGSTP